MKGGKMKVLKLLMAVGTSLTFLQRVAATNTGSAEEEKLFFHRIRPSVEPQLIVELPPALLPLHQYIVSPLRRGPCVRVTEGENSWLRELATFDVTKTTPLGHKITLTFTNPIDYKF